MDTAKITAELARQLLIYEPETGNFFWRQRPEHFFSATQSRTAGHAARNWNARFAGREAFTFTNAFGYKAGAIFGQTVLAHRVAWLMHFGEWPLVVDHINGKPSDNRICNLRNVSQAENTRNARLRSDNTSGVPGVQWAKRERRWLASVYLSGKRISLGSFNCIDEAIEKRNSARAECGYTERHGERADAN